MAINARGRGKGDTNMSVCTKPELQNGLYAHGSIAGDDVMRSEQYAQRAQTAARNATINKHRHQVGEHMQLFCSCDVVLTLELVCGLTKKKIMSM